MRYAVQQWSLFEVHLQGIGAFISQLGLRMLLAFEFWEAGIGKLNGENWFAEIQANFPFPFSIIPVEVSWQLSTWIELAGAAGIFLGLATRFFSLSLIILTLVAWVAVHSGNGYNVCDNGYKLPLIYLVMFVPLLLNGAGKVSLDHVISRCVDSCDLLRKFKF